MKCNNLVFGRALIIALKGQNRVGITSSSRFFHRDVLVIAMAKGFSISTISAELSSISAELSSISAEYVSIYAEYISICAEHVSISAE